jgi:tetratricopeptide (TPR) repeat protein
MPEESRGGKTAVPIKNQQAEILTGEYSPTGIPAMRFFPILVFCLLLSCSVQARIAEPLTSGIYPVNASLDSPPYNVTVYIADAQAAVAERNWTSALLLTTRGLAWYPENAELFCLQGYTYRKLGQYQKAVDMVSEGIRRDPEPVRYANRGYGYLALGNDSAALADADTGISLNASYTATYAVKALALQGLGRNSEARAAIGTALALDPASAHYWHVKGRLLAASGDCTGAREALQKSLALDPGYDLPYPGFTGARENLEAQNSTCPPATQGTHPMSPPAGGILAGFALVILVLGTRR